MAEVLTQIAQVMREVFGSPDLVVTRDTSAKTVQGWDSLTHVVLILGIETSFKMKFKAAELAGLKNVGELVDLIERRRAAK